MFRHKQLLLLLALTSLTACESSVGVIKGLNPHHAPASFQKAIARDAGLELQDLYLPAFTKIIITQSTNDPFGEALIADLRMRGYAIEEKSEKQAQTPKTSAPQTILHLSYLLDGIGENYWRLQLLSGSGTERYTRAYQNLDNPPGFMPLGSWTKLNYPQKEKEAVL
ncbi:hypothetical protein FAI40_08335 [Acetobacteraceae bacterium]|nr:hypothetical protein FAI40_08335 [Acetobacteraceae bacterium]